MADLDKNTTAQAFRYEEAVARLETIVRTLEQGESNVPLEQCMALYEEGVTLVRKCYATLKDAEQRVSILQRDADGEIITAPFASTEDE